MNHDHLKDNMIPLPDPHTHGTRPGYDARLNILQRVQPIRRRRTISVFPLISIVSGVMLVVAFYLVFIR